MNENKKKLYYSLGDVKNFGIDSTKWYPQSKIVLTDGSVIYTPNSVGEQKHELQKFDHSIMPVFVGKGIHYELINVFENNIQKELRAERWIKARIDSKHIQEVYPVHIGFNVSLSGKQIKQIIDILKSEVKTAELDEPRGLFDVESSPYYSSKKSQTGYDPTKPNFEGLSELIKPTKKDARKIKNRIAEIFNGIQTHLEKFKK